MLSYQSSTVHRPSSVVSRQSSTVNRQSPIVHRPSPIVLLALAALVLLAATGCAAWPWGADPSPTPTPTVRPTSTPEPLVPTPTPLGAATRKSAAITPTAAEGKTATPSPTPSPPSPAPTETAERATPTADVPTPSTTSETPTATATGRAAAPTARATEPPSATASLPTTEEPTETLAPTAPPAAGIPLPQGRERFGVGVGSGSISDYPVEAAGLGLGWYLNWRVQERPARPGGAEFWQMVWVSENGFRPPEAALVAAAAANPGSFWIIGNEPDVRWQGNTTPERYAELYHQLYHLLKEADPTCHVVIGGVSQPTPLRLSYLERMLSVYEARYGEPMPVDVWNVHGFILREERDSWGVDIPSGMTADTGVLYEIDDHDDLSILRSHIWAFRRWMADHGQRDKPLVVSEYGILMPSDYGFPPAAVRAFLEGSFDLFLTASDGAVGYPRDGGRLVQWWCWYSLAAPEDYYPTGNLFDPATKALTPLGAAFASYTGP